MNDSPPTTVPVEDAAHAEQMALAESMLYELDDDAADDGWVEAGAVMAPYVMGLKAASSEAVERQRRYMRLMTLLLPGLKQWLLSWHLGASFEAVYAEAQRCVYASLKQPSPAFHDWLEELLAEAEPGLPVVAMPARSRTASVLAQLFTAEDWQRLATVAGEGMSQGVLKVAERERDRVV